MQLYVQEMPAGDAAAEPGLGVMPGIVKRPHRIPGNFCTLHRKCVEPFLIVKKRLVNRGRVAIQNGGRIGGVREDEVMMSRMKC